MINSQVVPLWSDTTIPVVAEYRRLMDKYQPQVPSELLEHNYKPFKYGFTSLEGFINAKLLVEVLRRTSKDLTRKEFRKAVYKIKKLAIGLPREKVSFSEGGHQAMDSVFLTTVENGRYVSLVSWLRLMNPLKKVGISK